MSPGSGAALNRSILWGGDIQLHEEKHTRGVFIIAAKRERWSDASLRGYSYSHSPHLAPFIERKGSKQRTAKNTRALSFLVVSGNLIACTMKLQNEYVPFMIL